MRGLVSARSFRPIKRIWSWAEAVGHYDFCPWANRYVHWLKQPIGWFVAGALAALLVALFVAPQGWFVFGTSVAVMVLGVAWPWVSMHGLSATLTFDRGRCRETESVMVRLSVRNRWPWPAWGLVVERGFLESADDFGTPQAVTALARVPGWSQSQYVFTFRPERRGVYPHESPVLATGFPFGIWNRARPIRTQGELIVWPQTVPLTSVPAVGGERLTVAGCPVDRAGDDGDILAARFYREGDSLRRVHWAQTARRDVLVVCERQTTARRRVVVVLDGTAFAGPARQDGWRLDWAVRVFASLCHELHAHHCDVECRLNGQSCLLEPGPSGMRRLLDRLARYEPDLSLASRCDAGQSSTDSLVILVTRDLPTAPALARARRAARPRCVLVDDRTTDRNRPGEEAADPAARPWITLDTRADIAGQLQRQWGRLCHDNWRIN